MANLVRWNPFDDLFGAWPPAFFNWRSRDGADMNWRPRCDVTQSDGTMVVHAELPGVAEKDIEVTLEGGMLTVRGEKRSETKTDEKDRTYSERFYGSFERSVSVPAGIDQSKVEAKLKDGVLEVRVPLPVEAKAEAAKIPVKAA